MSDIFDDIFDESEALGNINAETGKQLSQLVRTLRDVERQIEDTEAHLKTLKFVTMMMTKLLSSTSRYRPMPYLTGRIHLNIQLLIMTMLHLLKMEKTILRKIISPITNR